MSNPPRTKGGKNLHNVKPNQTVAVSAQSWNGPLPPPAALEQFNIVVPGGAERIFRMAEQEQQHRIAQEAIGLKSAISEAKRGQLLGASISISAIISAVVAVRLGAHWSVSCALVGVPILGIVRAVVNSRSKK